MKGNSNKNKSITLNVEENLKEEVIKLKELLKKSYEELIDLREEIHEKDKDIK